VIYLTEVRRRKDDSLGRTEWGQGYFEHLLQHPELVTAVEPVQRVFHIGCTLHIASRNCLSTGNVSADFPCPLEAVDGPMMRLKGTSLSAPKSNKFGKEPK
jgi:hypothetical protein